MDRKGFTLIELLIVIAIIGILAAAVLVAVDPVGRIQDARNARRSSETNAILNAALNWQVDNTQLLASAPITNNKVIAHDTSSQMITTNTLNEITTAPTCPGGVTFASGAAGWANLNMLVSKYIATMPVDPATVTGSTTTYYYIRQSMNGRITVGSCLAENGSSGTAPTIKITR